MFRLTGKTALITGATGGIGIAIAKALSKRWLITDPEGNTFEIENLRAFGKEHNVDQGNLIKHGKSKGYVCLPL